MIQQLIHFSIKNRLFVLAAAFALTLYGLYEMARLPVDVLPDLNRPQVTVLTEAEGLAPEEVETLVTFPIETALNGSTGVQRVRSVSAVGLSIVFVEFGWGQDIYLARQLVGEKLAATRDRLPAKVEPRMGPISSIMGEIMLIGLKSETVPPVQLRLLADWTVRPRLLSIPGVANAIPIGGGRLQYQVQVDPEKLRAYNLTLEEVERAVANANENSTGGFIEKQSQEFLVRNIGRVRTIAEFADAVVTTREGTPLTVGNVARVLEGVQVKRGDASIDGQPAVIVMVSKQPGQDTLALTRTIEKAMAEIRATLPPAVELDDNVFRQQHFIEASIANVIEVMRDAAILVAVVLVLFLLNARTTLISLIAIPLSLIVTFIVFKFAGIGINTMTLGGLAIAIGELVDDSIIDIENVFRRLRENAARPAQQRLNPLRVIYDASNEVRSTLVYATVLMVIVFVPLFQLSGIEGRIFAPMGIAYIVSVLASLAVSLTVTPALAATLLSRYFDGVRDRLEGRGLTFRGGEAADSWIVRRLKAIDRVQLDFTLRHPALVMGAFYGLALVALAAALQLGREFLPPFNEGTITVTLIAAPGTSLSESNRIGALAEKELLAIGEVALVSRRTGRAELDEHAEGVHSSELEVDFRPGGRTQPAVLAEIRERLGRFPGMVVNVGQPISHRLDHLLSGVNAQIAVKVFGDDLATLRAKAEEVRAAMATVPGTTDVFVEKQVLIPQIRIQIHRDSAKLYGLQVGDLARTLEAALYGKTVTEVLDGQKTFDVAVKLNDEYRGDEQALADMLIDTPTGAKVPLRAVADVIAGVGPNQVLRENGQRRIAVQANVAGRDLGGVIADLQRAIEARVRLPAGYFITYGGQFEAQQQATRVIGLLSAVSLLLMYAILYNHFRSHRIVVCILMNIPQAAVGAVAVIWFTTGVFSIASLMGFITLTGISLRNGIMMINHYLHLMRREGETFGKAMIVRGSLERLVPVLMTTTTAALGLIPLAIAAGEPGKEILQPMAVVMLAGLITSTLLDLVYTPAFFWRWCGPVAKRLATGTEADFAAGKN
ncbi:MAG TPA: efflux RND transporter permease subunit [Candidatus Competibacter sp.]|nr:efflux RND transporter permease subunit [Candidatus Competibacter sp.]